MVGSETSRSIQHRTDLRPSLLENNEMNDLKFALRQLLRNPGFTAGAVLTLGLGIGVNTGIFTILNSFAFRSLPVPDSGRLASIFQTFPGNRGTVHRNVY